MDMYQKRKMRKEKRENSSQEEKFHNVVLNWYPGHMAKTKKELEQSVKLVDVIIELRDARMPISSYNESFKELYKNKKYIIVFNKADLINDEGKYLLKNKYKDSLIIDSKSPYTRKIIINKINDLSKDKIDKNIKRGIRNTEIRVMVVGIPNVGKSTFINNISYKKNAKVENKPGVTRSLQWFNIDKTIKLLDTPGILTPKFDSEKKATILSLLGSVNDDIIDEEKCAEYACMFLYKHNKDILMKRYNIDSVDEVIKQIAINKKIYKVDNELDYLKTAKMIINDVRDGKLGKLIWEEIDA